VIAPYRLKVGRRLGQTRLLLHDAQQQVGHPEGTQRGLTLVFGERIKDGFARVVYGLSERLDPGRLGEANVIEVVTDAIGRPELSEQLEERALASAAPATHDDDLGPKRESVRWKREENML
jgi:hypothetical protein